MALLHSPKIVTDGLVLCLDAANRKSYPGSGTVWRDLVGSNNGTLVNGVGYNSGNLGSLSFDGVDDLATFTTPSLITISTPQTWEVWCAVIKLADYGYIIHNNPTSNTTGQSFITIGIDANSKYYAALNGQFASMNSNINATSNSIYQIMLTWNGLVQTMYINGNFIISRNLTSIIYNLDSTTSIGSNYTTPTYRRVAGNIYNIKIYNKALTQTEVLQNYNALKGRYNL